MISLFYCWCAVASLLFCNFIAYMIVNDKELSAGTGVFDRGNREGLWMPNGPWHQLTFRGLLFCLGGIFFAVIAVIALRVFDSSGAPVDLTGTQVASAMWFGGLVCGVFLHLGARIGYVTAWALQLLK